MAELAEKIDLEEITSSNLAAIGWNPEKLILAVKFKSGAIFHYANADRRLVEAFYSAPSRGRFYSENIKGKLQGERMTGNCPKCGDKDGWIGETCSDCGTAVYEALPMPEPGTRRGRR